MPLSESPVVVSANVSLFCLSFALESSPFGSIEKSSQNLLASGDATDPNNSSTSLFLSNAAAAASKSNSAVAFKSIGTLLAPVAEKTPV